MVKTHAMIKTKGSVSSFERLRALLISTKRHPGIIRNMQIMTRHKCATVEVYSLILSNPVLSLLLRVHRSPGHGVHGTNSCPCCIHPLCADALLDCPQSG